MAKLQRFHSIFNWEPIDNYYGKKVEGLHIKKSSFSRTFCRCGNTENKFISKCPKCNNYNFEDGEKDERTHNTIYPIITDSIINKNFIHIYKKQLIYDERDDGSVLFKMGTDTDFKISLDTLEFNSNYSKSIFSFLDEHNLTDIILDGKILDFEPLLKKYEFFIYEEYPLLTKILLAISLNSNGKIFINDKDCLNYPYLSKAIAGNYLNYLESLKNDYYWFRRNNRIVTRDCEFEKKVGSFYKDKLALLENICKYSFDNLDIESACNSLRIITYRDIFEDRGNSLSDFLKKVDEKEIGEEDILYYYVENGLLSFREANNILRKFQTIYDKSLDMKGFSDSWKFYNPEKPSWWENKNLKDRISFRDFLIEEHLDFFDLYLKENIIVKRNDFVEGFIEQIYDMIQYDIPICEENFKLKTYNYLVNTYKLAEVYKLPQERINLFLDMFETNPLEAISLIKNRRKITDKEIENFLKKIK